MIAASSAALSLLYGIMIAIFTLEVDLLVYIGVGAKYFDSARLYTTPLRQTGLMFTYTPFAAMLFVPWAKAFSMVQAEVVWTIVNLACLFAMMYLTIRLVRPKLPATHALRWALTLMLPATLLDPVLLTIGFGQVNLLLALLVLFDLAGSRRVLGRTVPLGIATGLAAAVKLTPLIFLPYMLLTGRIRGARNCLITFLICGLSAFVASPSASYAYWTKYIFESSRAGGLTFVSDQNLATVLERFHHRPLPHLVLWGVLCVVAAGGLLLARAAQRSSSELLGVLVAATTGLLISPITWTHHIVWVVPAILWLALAKDRPLWGRGFACFAAVLFWVSPIWWVPNNNGRELHERGWQLLAGNSFGIAMVLFMGGIALTLATRTRRRSLVRSITQASGPARSSDADDEEEPQPATA